MANYSMRYIDRETCLIIFKFKYALSLHRRWIDNSDATCKLVFVCLGVSPQLAPFRLQKLFVLRLLVNCLFLFIQLWYTITLMIFLKHNQEISFWMELKLTRGVPCLDYSLSKLLTDVFNWKNSYCVFCNCYNSFRTSFGAESTCMAENIIAQGCDSVLSHVFVTKPWFVWESNDRILTILFDFRQFYCFCSQELLSAISQCACNIID